MVEEKLFDWTVIGAGPAGIAAIGKLLDAGVQDTKIAWIDPAFKVGDLGTRWCKVSSNTKVELFLKFLNECRAFEYQSSPPFALKKVPGDETCLLGLMIEPLTWITEKLKIKVHAVKDKVQQLELVDRSWKIDLSQSILKSKNVILATGAEPKSLSFPGVQEIPLYTALDPDALAACCSSKDVVAVFGASHSAILILKTLVERCHPKKIINFYRSFLRYAIEMGDWILFDDTGLKGQAAVWAREHINGKLPPNLERIISNQSNIREFLPSCNKVIYATGFQRRLISIIGMDNLAYNERNGILAPGLFGIGIAYPEAKTDRFGTVEHRVGLWKFIQYLDTVLPVWLRYTT